MFKFPATILLFILAFAASVAAPARAEAQASPFHYRGVCDASAAVAVGTDTFLVADDEDNTLRLYRYNQPHPIRTFDMGPHLGVSAGKEADIEGAAAIGARIYWISSHGLSDKGKDQPRRRRLFATQIAGQGESVTVTPAGTAYAGLLEDLMAAPQLAKFNLRTAATYPPKAPEGLNIEGLAATRDGKLLIGFRNPRPQGKALIVPLDNPAEVIAGAKARLGQPILLDLGGLGIRSLEAHGDAYLVVAGAYDDANPFAIYRWSGAAADPPKSLGIKLGDLRPEAIFPMSGGRDVQILSDDGKYWGEKCEDLPPKDRKFRGIAVTP